LIFNKKILSYVLYKTIAALQKNIYTSPIDVETANTAATPSPKTKSLEEFT